MTTVRPPAGPVDVAAALEGLGEPRLDHVGGDVGAEHARAEDEHVRVVVAAAHDRREMVVAERRADALDLVRDDAHADAGAADEYAALGLMARDGFGGHEAPVGVIDANLARRRAAVHDFVSRLYKSGLDFLFEFITGVVCAH